MSDLGTALNNEGILHEGDHLSSGNGYYAVMQHDGNFVVYTSHHWVSKNAIWASSTYNKGVSPRKIRMQNDGNLVIYDCDDTAIWASDTWNKGTEPYRLIMQTDGNLVIYDGDNIATWQTEISDLLLKTYPSCTKYCFTCNDTLSPLLTAVKGGGVVIIAGTGSNCLFFNNDNIINCGGWGHLLGDKGGAHWLVLKGLRTIYEDMDGFKRSLYSTDYLKQAMFDYFKMNDKYCMLPHLYPTDGNINKKMIAKFCVEGILKGAVNGDLLCLHLFKSAGVQLGKHIKALIPKIDLKMLHAEGGLKVICVGSVWKSWDYLKEGFLSGLTPLTDEEKQLREITLVKLKPEAKASYGACLWAAGKAGLSFPMDYEKMSFAFFNYKFF